MDIAAITNITGRNVEITAPLHDFTMKKLDRLTHHVLKISSVKVVLNIETKKQRQTAEATVRVPGAEIHASSTSQDLYAAIDDLVDKLDRQLKKHKEKNS